MDDDRKAEAKDSLTQDGFARLAASFERISRLEPASRRAELEAMAEQDPAVHRELVRMLAQQTGVAEAEAGLDAMASGLWQGSDGADTGPESSGLKSGSMIGDRFLLEEPLGVGGMGDVWSAEQLRPIARRVAIKVLRPGTTSRASATRLRAERQALANMDHPNIARVYDGGEVEGGEPYFVMELVPESLPISDYCDQHRLGLESRLRLMLQVCDAIEHAHQKRIIHRDLKPSNVLVCDPIPGSGGDGALVKVIDFGIAKPIAEADHPAGTTRAGELVGTPDYMSPEQATLGAVDVDTRSDIYSLGLLLFELLVGELPLGKDLGDLPLDEQCRRIREQEPPRPSTRLRQLSSEPGSLDSTGGDGGADIDWRRVRGDLDLILLKALAKDRQERYPSVAAMAADLRRFLSHEPVHVAPRTLAYRAKKFVRRHRLAVTLGSLTLVAIGIALAGITVGFVRAQKAEAVARTEAATTRQISEFLEGLLRESNPEETEGADSLRALLDRGAERVRTELRSEPAVRGRLMLTIADAYRALGLYEPALELAEEGLQSYRSLPDRDTQREAQALDVLCHIQMNARQHGPALKTAREHHQLQIERLGGRHPDLADSLFQIGTVHWALGEFEDARALLEEAVALRSTPQGPVHGSLPRLQNNLAILYWRLDRLDDAERLYREALDSLRAVRGPEHPHVASTLNNLALVYEHRGEFEQAIDLHRQAIAIREKIFESPHPDLAESLNNLGSSLYGLGRIEEAKEVLQRALIQRRAIFGDGPNDLVATTVYNLANVVPPEAPDRARELYEEALRGFEGSAGVDHPSVAFPLLELGELEQRAGRAADALPLIRRAFQVRQQGLPPDHPLLDDARDALCSSLRDLDRNEEAATLQCGDGTGAS
ncbi:MAG: serine/threonine-protein kinase [Acidobacteriota bacterium]